MEKIPVEILCHILSYLSPQDLVSSDLRVNRAFHAAAWHALGGIVLHPRRSLEDLFVYLSKVRVFTLPHAKGLPSEACRSGIS